MDIGFGGGDMTFFWVMSLISGVVGLAITIGIIALIILGIRWLIRQNSQDRLPPPPAGAPTPDPLDVLRGRYARGEIDEEEYERRRKTLSGG